MSKRKKSKQKASKPVDPASLPLPEISGPGVVEWLRRVLPRAELSQYTPPDALGAALWWVAYRTASEEEPSTKERARDLIAGVAPYNSVEHVDQYVMLIDEESGNVAQLLKDDLVEFFFGER